MALLYRRVLLKLSGEVLAGTQKHGIDPAITGSIADEIAAVHADGVQVGIVIGGGNILRGASTKGVSRVAGDTMGMLATVINSIALAESLSEQGVPAEVLTAVHIDRAGEFYTASRAKALLEAGTVVVIAGGTGNPFFTTDTAAALRCAEVNAEVLLKATKVDGIYDSDPAINPAAVRFTSISHAEALSRQLKVMDATAFSFCQENDIPIIIFKLMERGNLRKSLEGSSVGSIIRTGG
ncbi:MAG: UMP kinase [Chitinispirillaceae bacterium]|nr:UMP kinase [Chitinispirillaceae bacterium]